MYNDTLLNAFNYMDKGARLLDVLECTLGNIKGSGRDNCSLSVPSTCTYKYCVEKNSEVMKNQNAVHILSKIGTFSQRHLLCHK